MNLKWVALGVLFVPNLVGGARKENTKLTSHGISYEFPASHVAAKVLPPDGSLFVKLRPPGHRIMLILDETIDRKGVIERPGVPKVSRVSDVHPVRVMHFKSGPAVCIDVSQGRWTCGLRIEDGQVAWSVLFDAERLQDADLIRNEARNLVREYKVGR